MVKGKSSRGVATRSIRRGHPERIITMPPTQPCVAAFDVGRNLDINLMGQRAPIDFTSQRASIDLTSQKAPIDFSDTIGDKAFANNIDFPDCITIDINFKRPVLLMK